VISDLSPGMRCGDYELLAFIGKGGMAQVWSARNTVNRELVAIKTLLPLYAADPVLQERLAREGESQKTLRHPNILKAHGTFRLDGSIFMVMDLVDGESLERYMRRRRRIPVPEVRGIAQSVLGALHHAHEANIVHRDVKPSNILLSRSGRILLSDFGIALLRNAVRLTRIGGIGTPCYMSPEQIVGRDIGPLSDIYSVGCVLYELLTGLPPFHAEGPAANEWVRDAHQFTPPAPLLPNHPEVPPALANAVMRALEKAPAARFQSCAEFAAALGVSVQLLAGIGAGHLNEGGAAGGSAHSPLSEPAEGRPASGIEMPRVVTPVENPSGQRPSSTPRVQLPLSGAGVTIAKPSGPTSGRHTPAAVVSTVRKHPGSAGIAAIAAAVLLAAFAVLRWQESHATPGKSGDGQSAASGVSAQRNPTGASAATASARATGGTEPAAAGNAPGDRIGQGSSEVSTAIDQIKQTYDKFQRDTTPAAPEEANAATGSALPKRPTPMAFGRTSGVLQWTGSKGESVEIDGTKASRGILTGDTLPGVPVRVWIDGDNEGIIIQRPSDADGYRKLLLRMTADNVRIRWQKLDPGQTK